MIRKLFSALLKTMNSRCWSFFKRLKPGCKMNIALRQKKQNYCNTWLTAKVIKWSLMPCLFRRKL